MLSLVLTNSQVFPFTCFQDLSTASSVLNCLYLDLWSITTTCRHTVSQSCMCSKPCCFNCFSLWVFSDSYLATYPVPMRVYLPLLSLFSLGRSLLLGQLLRSARLEGQQRSAQIAAPQAFLYPGQQSGRPQCTLTFPWCLTPLCSHGGMWEPIVTLYLYTRTVSWHGAKVETRLGLVPSLWLWLSQCMALHMLITRVSHNPLEWLSTFWT